MIYIISVNTFGKNNVHDIQSNSCWSECALDGYVVIPDEMVDAVLATKGYCDIVLNNEGTELASFTARAIPPATPSIADIDMICSDFAEMEEKIGQLYDLIENNTSRSHLFYYDGKFIKVFVLRITESEGAVYIGGNSDASQRRERVRHNGEWQEWEWENPPLELGVEYRTTERWLGKPVYIRVLQTQNLGQANEIVTYTFNYISGVQTFIDYGGVTSGGEKFPCSINSINSIGMHVSKSGRNVYVEIVSAIDRSSETATVWLKYTKND